ncbi:hypothetical protein P280DRAFT_466053 [Massarina eburnea CBS 473.64]|uniref:Cyclin-D1-binding protein 1-like N-terminal domain-containing protein n=1 Tax=Massarina eburnea CBS 473.64 TaxID=1395130 RepID=A0A6A6SD37_9PLEO|nr:hypothetical protein P280DRAFT_466053 [Massarina eburnea CBS 473.64]
MAKPNDLRALIDLTKTTPNLLTHYLSSLSSSTSTTASSTSPADLPNPLDVAKACTTLLKSHTTTLSLLLLTPPFTPSALITKIGDVSSGVLSNLVAGAAAEHGTKDGLGSLMRNELRAGVRRVLGGWGEVLALVLRLAERRQSIDGKTPAKKDPGPTESERQEILAATGVVWNACDGLLKFCDNGIVGLVVKKAEEWRSVLLDAVEELKEWGEDVDEDEDDEAEGSDLEDDEFRHDDDIFGAANKLGKGDKEIKALLDRSVKKLKMVGMLYQALIKRRLKTFPATAKTDGDGEDDAMVRLQKLMEHLRAIPENVDDLASAFYDLDEEEAKKTFEKCCEEAKSAVALVRQSWTSSDDEFTAWSQKWVDALDVA